MDERDKNMDEKILAAAMDIIIHAGDARSYIAEALGAIARPDFTASREKLKKAQEEITVAHCVQTNMIQGEARGEGIGHSLLFTHAQDTLMTINSELNMAKQLYKIFEAYETRISLLEGKVSEIK